MGNTNTRNPERQKMLPAALLTVFIAIQAMSAAAGERTEKPVLHGSHWVAITGKPLAATAGAMTFIKGGNAVDAACAMLGAVCTMYDMLSWGGETQSLIFNPKTRKVIGINALGAAPTGATPEYFQSKGLKYPPAYGPLAAVTPGTPGGLMVMLAEFGTMSLGEVLGPSLRLAEGYPVEKELADSIEKEKARIKDWPYSRKVLLPHLGESPEAPAAGEFFRQPELKDTLLKLVDAESRALAAGKSRREAIYAAYDRFYKGDIAREFARGSAEQGGLITVDDLAGWKVRIEEPVTTNYKGTDVYKLTCWVQGPVMLQALNMLENIDLKALGFNTAKYLHLLYQVMNLAFADRDFYYGDPYYPPEEPLRGLLSKSYARSRVQLVDWDKNCQSVKPGDPYPFEGKANPFLNYLENWESTGAVPGKAGEARAAAKEKMSFFTGTTSVQAADAEGWVVSMTPSGGWIPACLAGRTGVGMSQRMQSFVLDERENPFNVVRPGKRPRATLTPGLALKNGAPFLSFAVQGGDTQDQNLLQFFLNVFEFGMNVQQACEAPNMTSYQMRNSFSDHKAFPGKMDVHESVPSEVRSRLEAMGYELEVKKYTSGPINAIFFDRAHGTFWGGSSNYGEDYGIAW